jgi:hypothetical protein
VPLDPVLSSLTAYPAFDSLEAEAVVVAVAASVEEVVVVGGGLVSETSTSVGIFKLISFTSQRLYRIPDAKQWPDFISSDQKSRIEALTCIPQNLRFVNFFKSWSLSK